jgi:hypothetical protein
MNARHAFHALKFSWNFFFHRKYEMITQVDLIPTQNMRFKHISTKCRCVALLYSQHWHDVCALGGITRMRRQYLLYAWEF